MRLLILEPRIWKEKCMIVVLVLKLWKVGVWWSQGCKVFMNRISWCSEGWWGVQHGRLKGKKSLLYAESLLFTPSKVNNQVNVSLMNQVVWKSPILCMRLWFSSSENMPLVQGHCPLFKDTAPDWQNDWVRGSLDTSLDESRPAVGYGDSWGVAWCRFVSERQDLGMRWSDECWWDLGVFPPFLFSDL